MAEKKIAAKPAPKVAAKAEKPAAAPKVVKETPPAVQKEKALVIPKKLGDVADLLFKTRAERLATTKKVEELQARETALKNHLIDNLPKSEATGVAGKAARVQIVVKQRLGVKNWEEVYAYIKKNNAFDMLQRRLSDTAVKDRLEAGKKVPGVEFTAVADVSITKL